MTDGTPNPFNFGSGLLDDEDVTITDAEFGYDDDFTDDDGDPIFCLMLDVHPESDDSEDTTVLLTCGEAFTTRDGGKTAVRHDEKDKTFNKNSKVAVLVNSIIENGGKDDLMAKWEQEGVGPQHAEFYKGMRFHLSRVEVEYKKLGRTGTNTVCSEWHGYVGSGSNAPAKAKGKPAPAAKAKAKGKPAAEAGGLTDELLAELDAIADDAADFPSFVEAALEHLTDDQSADDTILDAIKDGESDEGIWGRAVDRA